MQYFNNLHFAIVNDLKFYAKIYFGEAMKKRKWAAKKLIFKVGLERFKDVLHVLQLSFVINEAYLVNFFKIGVCGDEGDVQI